MSKYRRSLVYLFMALVVLLTSVFLFVQKVSAQGIEQPRPLSVNRQIIQNNTEQIAQKALLLQDTSRSIETLEGEKKTLADKLANEKATIEQLRQRIAQKKEAERIKARRAVQPVSAALPAGGCGDNPYSSYIYSKESGCRTTARNAGGCYGIGQACPGSKVAQCGADYACQNAWFSNYAIQRYGSWASAYNFHKANGWW